MMIFWLAGFMFCWPMVFDDHEEEDSRWVAIRDVFVLFFFWPVMLGLIVVEFIKKTEGK